jgi:hypothetical protein
VRRVWFWKLGIIEVIFMVEISKVQIEDWIDTLSRYEGIYTDNGYLEHGLLEDMLNELRDIREDIKKEEKLKELLRRTDRFVDVELLDD